MSCVSKKLLALALIALAVVVALVVVLLEDQSPKITAGTVDKVRTGTRIPEVATAQSTAAVSPSGPAAASGATRAAESPEDAEAAQADAEEAKVDAFDNLTDKWMEPAKTGVTMSDVEAFVKTFRKVPKSRQDECVHRALNLIPDENVMLLAGILMDKSMDKEIVETVFNDVLNRDEAVKMPIMRQIFKDKSHPSWADVAWILDVTGEK